MLHFPSYQLFQGNALYGTPLVFPVPEGSNNPSVTMASNQVHADSSVSVRLQDTATTENSTPTHAQETQLVAPVATSRVQIPGEITTEEPLFVNAKQYLRILKRRQQRAKLEAEHKVPKQRRRYLHESRHQHAMRRKRAKSGRFMTKSEIEAVKAREAATGEIIPDPVDDAQLDIILQEYRQLQRSKHNQNAENDSLDELNASATSDKPDNNMVHQMTNTQPANSLLPYPHFYNRPFTYLIHPGVAPVITENLLAPSTERNSTPSTV